MLWVTMTTVTSSAISRIVSSIRRVEVGSRAEHGSSMSSTDGRTASARAMQSRCCWPPESSPPRALRRFRTSFQSPAFVSISSTRPSASRAADPAEAEARKHVVVDRHRRERVGLLEDHPDLESRLGGTLRRPVDLDPVEMDRSGELGAGTTSCIRLRIRRKVDLPQPDGPIRAVTFDRLHDER